MVKQQGNWGPTGAHEGRSTSHLARVLAGSAEPLKGQPGQQWQQHQGACEKWRVLAGPNQLTQNLHFTSIPRICTQVCV